MKVTATSQTSGMNVMSASAGERGAPSTGSAWRSLSFRAEPELGAPSCHFQNDRRGQAQRDGGEHLVGDAEQRPERIDAAQRVAHALDQEITPARHHQHAGQQIGAQVARVAQRFPEVPEKILKHIAAHARAGVHRGQDEQRLEHDREVIPKIEPRVR